MEGQKENALARVGKPKGEQGSRTIGNRLEMPEMPHDSAGSKCISTRSAGQIKRKRKRKQLK